MISWRKGAPFNEIIFRYYLNFIPYFRQLVQLAVRFYIGDIFYLQHGYNTEIISYSDSGVSFFYG
jgi:lipopolysaccharide export system permease protein